MKIAIHHAKGSFSEGWISYCENNNIEYKIVNAFSTNIINDVLDCDVFMWHFHHLSYKDTITAQKVLFSLDQAGIKVFPDMKTCWHFDDKVAQKYLLEAIQAPLIPSHIFYNEQDALKWVASTKYPIVFKLKGGAGATNVELVKNKNQAIKKINKAFSRGYPYFNKIENLKEKWRKFKSNNGTLKDVFIGVYRLFVTPKSLRYFPKEIGYAYFQEFISGNDGDIRLIIIDGKYAYGMKRVNRKGDFRASGSSEFIYESIPESVLKTGFQVAKKLNLQSVAFDFVFDEKKNPLIIEVSYAFGTKGSSQCKGYWKDDLSWHEGVVNPYEWQIESFIK